MAQGPGAMTSPVKACDCIMLSLPGSAIQTLAEAQGFFVQAMNGLYGGRFVRVGGGVLIRNGNGAIRGAAGVTGDSSDNDAACAVTGIRAAGLTAEA